MKYIYSLPSEEGYDKQKNIYYRQTETIKKTILKKKKKKKKKMNFDIT